tara:strand:- start:456 stop:968 length:513 start_codon:yes stop_codon:yes gene_type:complete
MALSFLTNADHTVEVVVTCDPEVEADESQRSAYIQSGDLSELGSVSDQATRFTLKALSPSEREDAEVRAGALRRSELGRLLWSEAPIDSAERARWHHALTDDEREAMSGYNSYINRVYVEMLRASIQLIDGEEASVDQLELIRPDSHRTDTISQLVLHVQRISLLGDQGK